MTMNTDTPTNTTLNDDSRFLQTCSSITNDAIGIILFLLVMVFPLIFHHSYYDILETKYHFYRFCIFILLCLLSLLSLGMLCVDLKKFHGEHTGRLLAKLLPSNWRTAFHAADLAVLAFWLATGISTLQSDFLPQSFWGNEGRYSGFLLITLYMISYFIISRFWRFKGIFLELFLISGILLCLFGITDYFQMDILHFRTEPNAVSAMQSFTSTIGNINTYTAYVGMLLGLSAVLFALEKKPFRKAWYYLCLLISFFAIIMGRSDNAYLSLAAVFALLPFVLFTSKNGIQKYLIITASFFTVIEIVNLLNQRYADVVMGLDGLFSFLTSSHILIYIIPLLWSAVVISYFFRIKQQSTPLSGKIGSHLTRIWGAFLLLSLFVVFLLFLDVNIGGNSERYGTLGSYLLFNDSWGSHRGYIWKQSARLYMDLPLLHKLFGSGPDTYGCLVKALIMTDVENVLGQYLDNAHNAFLQYLVTIGIVGLITYLVFLGTSFAELFRNRMKNSYIPAVLLAAACYAAQSLVNLDLPVVTPMMWLLISMGVSGCRQLPDQ